MRLIALTLLLLAPAFAQAAAVTYLARFIADSRLVASAELKTIDGKEVATDPAKGPLMLKVKPELLPTGEIRTEGQVEYRGPEGSFSQTLKVKTRSGQPTGINETSDAHTYQFELRAIVQ